ncbi:DUF6894 family protein [Bradyrhizobium barranii]|uniref:DUF6894 family protein n=1 Tax=Bradyrhizobium barranii TaxID=2992140 RepID=UPI00403429BC
MPTFYFDHHSSGDSTVDDEGVDLANQNAAKRLALEYLAQLIMDRAARVSTGQISVEVRDHDGPVLRASAAIMVEDL